VWEKITDAASPDWRQSWFRRAVEKLEDRFVAIQLRLYRGEREQAAEVALFLDQLLDAYPVPAGTERLKLGSVKRENAITERRLVADSIEQMHKLRTERSHALPEHRRRAAARAAEGTDWKRVMAEAADLIGRELKLRCVTALVRTLVP